MDNYRAYYRDIRKEHYAYDFGEYENRRPILHVIRRKIIVHLLESLGEVENDRQEKD